MATTTNRKYELIGENVTPDVKYWFNRLAGQLDVDIQKVQGGWAADPQFVALAQTAITNARKPAILTTGNVDAMADGWYQFRTPADLAAVEGKFPLTAAGTKQPGFLFQVTTTNGIKFQIYFAYASGGTISYRATGSVTAGSLIGWRALWTEPAPANPITADQESPFRRSVLEGAFKRRRGNVVGTAGKPVVALRFDHGWNNFKNIVLPLLDKYDLPWLQATNSRQNTTATNVSQNTEVTLADVQDMALRHGGEIANHGATHRDATTTEALLDEIIGGLTELQTAMPQLAIEHWCPPGIGAGGYMGYSNMSTPEHMSTQAGRLVQAHHAGVSGYVTGLYRPLPASLEIGLVHYTMDEATPAQVAARVGVLKTLGTPAGMLLMVHPSLIGGEGYMSAAQLETVFADLALRRDLGEIEILTPGGLLLADHRTDHRNELLPNADFAAGLSGWSAAGWTLKTENGKPYVVPANNAPLTRTVEVGGNMSSFTSGSVREVLVRARPLAGRGSLTVTVTAGDLTVTKTYTDLDPTVGWVNLRNHLVIPMDARSVTVSVARGAGSPEVHVSNISLRSV